MYAKIKNNCIIDASKIEKEGYTYLEINYDSFIKNQSKGLYKRGLLGIILKNGLPEINKVSENHINQTDTSTTVNKKEERLRQIKEQFEKAIDMNIKWKNNQYYKPRYASENYEPLLAANTILELKSGGTKSLFPKEVWDATKLHSSVMTADELQELALFLANIYERQFQQYKRAYAKILEEQNKG